MRFCLISQMLICLFPSMARAAGCVDVKGFNTKITINIELPGPVYDFKKTIAEINVDRTNIDDWLKREGLEKVWESKQMATLGYAKGDAGLNVSDSIQIRNYDRYGAYYCLFMKELTINMMFRTQIVIPKEFDRGGCRFNLVHTHEMLHYQTNRDTVQKFVERLYKDLPIIIREVENAQPYVLREKVPQALKTSRQAFQDAIHVYIIESMREELARRNNKIDSPEEYARGSFLISQCAD